MCHTSKRLSSSAVSIATTRLSARSLASRLSIWLRILRMLQQEVLRLQLR